MFLPPQYAWFEPVLVASVVVFVIDLIGAQFSFGSRIIGALMSAIVFALVFGALTYFGYGTVTMTLTAKPAAGAPAETSPLPNPLKQ